MDAGGARYRLPVFEILQPLEPFRNYVNVVSDLGHAPVAPWTGEDTGGAENHGARPPYS